MLCMADRDVSQPLAGGLAPTVASELRGIFASRYRDRLTVLAAQNRPHRSQLEQLVADGSPRAPSDGSRRRPRLACAAPGFLLRSAP